MRGDALGSLHGVPISIKDLQMMKGVRATLGSLAYKDNVPAADSAVVERVKGDRRNHTGQDEYAGIRLAWREREPPR